jgi:hypothetical protein
MTKFYTANAGSSLMMIFARALVLCKGMNTAEGRFILDPVIFLADMLLSVHIRRSSVVAWDK